MQNKLYTILVDCGRPESPKSGIVTLSDTVEGSIAYYVMRCNGGCILGDIYRICENSGQWSGYLPECHRELEKLKF